MIFKNRVLMALLLTAAVGRIAVAAENGAKETDPTQGQQSTTKDKKADELVHKWADFYAAKKSFSEHIDVDMNVQGGGKQKDVQSSIDVKVSKPDRFYWSMESPVLGGKAIVDGKSAYLYSPTLNAYTKQSMPKDARELFDKPEFAFVTGGYSSISLFEATESSTPYEDIMHGVKDVRYVGQDKVDGVACNHLHFTEPEVNWDVWIQDGSENWVKKVVPDMSALVKDKERSSGVKDMKIDLSFTYKDMIADPKLTDADFTFTPPDQTKEVASFFKGSAEGDNPLVNKPAPAFKLDNLNGGSVSLDQFKGKNIVVLDFWATWCPPCRRALPIIADVTEGYKSKGVVFFAVNQAESPEQVKQYLKHEGLKVSVAMDADKAVARSYGVRGIPQMVIIGKNGIVQDVHVGYSPELKEALGQSLDQAIAQEKSGEVAGKETKPPAASE